MGRPLASSSTSLSMYRIFRISGSSISSMRTPQMTPVILLALGLSPGASLKKVSLDRLAARSCSIHVWAPANRVRDAISLIEGWKFRTDGSGGIWPMATSSRHNYLPINRCQLVLGTRGPVRFMDVGFSLERDCMIKNESPPLNYIYELLRAITTGQFLHVFGLQPAPGWTILSEDG